MAGIEAVAGEAVAGGAAESVAGGGADDALAGGSAPDEGGEKKGEEEEEDVDWEMSALQETHDALTSGTKTSKISDDLTSQISESDVGGGAKDTPEADLDIENAPSAPRMSR